ncbi:MAG TPA: sulfatase-like hydrolase/transferase, partial [Geminicoccaceae bacterium]|nr:sulfatase-like hydrolase/transferase [Geminicoccaceae bacterium]
MAADGPNLLFIFSDQHTQKVAGCYGDPIVETPNLDRLAARGVVFDNACTPSPLRTPARMSLLTGRYPSAQGCWTNGDVLPSDLPTYAHSLGAAGYRTTLVGRLHSIGPDQLRGFAERLVGDHGTSWIGGRAHGLGALDGTNDPYRVSVDRSGPGRSSYEVKDRDVTAAALAHLDDLAAARGAGDRRPFATVVGFILPHQPFVCAPEDYARHEGRVGPPDLPPPERERPYLRAWREHTGILDVPEETAVRARTAYYGLVASMDRMIGRILDRLEANRLAEDTLVVYASDHGDQIGERGLWWKQTFYDESAKVPLILSWPGALPEGERRAQVVNLIDLTATMLDALGAPALPNAEGRSFLRVAKDGTTPWLDETFSEYCTDGMSPWTLPTPVRQRMVRSGRWKLNYYHGHRPQLFDLEADPHETRDLAEDPAHATVRD